MELWLIGNKAIVLVYVITSALSLGMEKPEFVLINLLYVIISVLISLFKSSRVKQGLVIVSVFLIVYAAGSLNPIFLLLLPVSLYELMRLLNRHPLFALIGVGITALFIHTEALPLYLMLTSMSYLLLIGIDSYQNRLLRLDDKNELMRADLERITKRLTENDEYIRQSEYTIKLEERNHLSQRIHDEVGHAMAGALIQMEAARMLLERDADKAAELLGNAIFISKDGLERIRLTLKELKPKSEELGIHRLRLFADAISAQHGIPTTLTYEGDLDILKPIHWKIMQENAKEAVTNTLKYGQATSISFEVRVFPKLIRFVAADNGVGTEQVIKGLGIVGMEERAATVGGTVLVDGTHGFRVTTLLPLRVDV